MFGFTVGLHIGVTRVFNYIALQCATNYGDTAKKAVPLKGCDVMDSAPRWCNKSEFVKCKGEVSVI